MHHLIGLESHVKGKNRRFYREKYNLPTIRKSPDFSLYCYKDPRLAYDVKKHDRVFNFFKFPYITSGNMIEA